MIFELAIVEDRGTHYLATGTTKSSFDNLANREEKMLKLSYSSYQKISEALAENKIVTISKELMTDEVLPREVTVSEEAMDDLDAYKKINMRRVNKKMTYSMTNMSSLDVLAFTTLNNELIAEGYVITNGNREEKYIEIIEKDDEALIEKLEKYLIMLDKVTDVLEFSNMCSEYNEKIMNAEDEESIDTILAEFYTEYDKFNQ
jgi:hypothetical protein